MRRWVRGAVVAAVVGLGVGAVWLPGSSGADETPPIEVAAEALGPNLLVNASFEAPAITGGYRTIEPGTTLGTCRTIPGVTVKAGCWTSVNGFAGVDLVRTLWPAHHGKQSLDLNAAFGAGGVMQATPVTPGPHYLLVFARRSPNAPAGDPTYEFSMAVTFFNSAGRVVGANRANASYPTAGDFRGIGVVTEAPAGSVAAVVMVNSDRNYGAYGVVVDSVSLTRQ